MTQDPVYTLAGDVSDDFRDNFKIQVEKLSKALDRSLATAALGANTELAFEATRDGEVIHLMYPQHVKEGDLLGSVITLLATQLPTCIVHQGTASWSEPEWTSESRAHLAGIVGGLRDIPKSFAHSSQPADLARVSLWISTCNSALSVPGGVKDAVGDILPQAIASGKSAAKYMTKVVQGLRSNISDDASIRAVDTLSMLIKMWQKSQHENALEIIRKCKISWSSVLFRGASTKVIKGKKNRPDQRVVVSPPKPSKSPWLSTAERSELGNLYKADWSALDGIRNEFVALMPEQQHRQFNYYVKRVKEHFVELNNTANLVHARLGKRKHWIEQYCKNTGFKPNKKGVPESFQMAEHFFKQDLKGTHVRVVKIFAPNTYLPDPEGVHEDTWHGLIPKDDATHRITSADFNLENCGPTFKLWRIWADMFKPSFTKTVVDEPEEKPVTDRNIFATLFGLTQAK